MSAASSISAPAPEVALGPADIGFVAGLTAIALPVVHDAERREFLLRVLAEFRPALSDHPQILGLALSYDAIRVLTPWSGDWRREFEDIRERLARFNEWRLGRAQDAYRRRQNGN